MQLSNKYKNNKTKKYTTNIQQKAWLFNCLY